MSDEQPGPGGICDTCGHFALRHGEAGCHGVDPAKGCRFGKNGQPCTVMHWIGQDWPRPWLAAPEGLTLAPCLACPNKRRTGRLYCSWACYLADRVVKERVADSVVIDRLCLGDRTTSTRAERIEAVRILTEKGRSASWIAMLLHTTERSITRYRAINRLSLEQKAA